MQCDVAGGVYTNHMQLQCHAQLQTMHQQLIWHQCRAFEKNDLRASFQSLSEFFKLRLMKAILTLKSEQICNFKKNIRNGGAIVVALLLSSCVLLAFPLSCFNT